jgi:hypothetical protein
VAALVEQNKTDNKVLTTLPEEEQSQTWRTAVTLFNISLPLVMMVPILVYATDVRYDVVCTLANLSNSLISVDTCQFNIFSTGSVDKQQFEFYKNSTGFRWPLFQCAIWTCVIFAVFELCVNQVQIKKVLVVY